MSDEYKFFKDMLDQMISRVDRIEQTTEEYRKNVHDRLTTIHKDLIVRSDKTIEKHKNLENKITTIEVITDQNSKVTQELVTTLKEIQKYYQAQQIKKEQRKTWLINTSVLVTIGTGLAALLKHFKFW